jgi:plasmid stabilization system protein ParE
MPLESRIWRLSKSTVADLDGIWAHTAQNWSADQADQYHNDIMDVIADLAADRKRGRKIEINGQV